MLDTDPTDPTAGSNDASPDAAPPAPRKRAPRKAAKKAAPADMLSTEASDAPTSAAPAAGAPSTDAPPADAPAARTPRKRTPRKATSPVQTPAESAPAEPAGAQTAAEPDPASAADVPTRPARKATRRPARKAAPATDRTDVDETQADPQVETSAPGVAFTAADAAPAETAAPAHTPRKRTPRKAAANVTNAEPTAAQSTDAEATPAQDGASTAPALAAPGVLFMAPNPEAAEKPTRAPRKRAPRKSAAPVVEVTDAADAAVPTDDELEALAATPDADGGPTGTVTPETDTDSGDDETEVADPEDVREAAIEQASGARRRRRRGRRGRGGGARSDADDTDDTDDSGESDDAAEADDASEADDAGDPDGSGSDDSSDSDGPSTASRRRRRRRRSATGDDDSTGDDPPNTVVHVREPKKAREPRESGGRDNGGSRDSRDDGDDGVRGIKGSTRLEAKRQRRRDGRETTRRRTPILSESEFLARREAVERVMAVRQNGDRTQIAVLEDDILVEHYVTRASATSYVGNVYLGRVQNVLPSMEAAFIDIGKGRNGVLYAGEVNWDAAGLDGRSRTIEHAMKSGDSVLVQVSKDPVGHKGARLTSQVSLPGRFLVLVPGGGMTGISRRLPDTERHRLKAILKKIVPEEAGVIVRTAAEGASEEDLTRDVERLVAQWEQIQSRSGASSTSPALLHGEPDLAIRVVRDVFNEDFTSLVVQGDEAWTTISDYLGGVAPDLAERASRYDGNADLFHDLRVDEQLAKALDRKVYLPSGGSLVIDRTEAMTVIDVNTGKYIGSGGNLEQTVTRNNIEAAEEVVRQLRLRDVGGIVVIDFIDMVLESNRDLVLRRLTECLGRDRTKHQVAEVTSLGLVQMTRKRVGEGLLEAFSENCEHCQGRGIIVHSEPVDKSSDSADQSDDDRPQGKGKRRRGGRGGATVPEPVEVVPPASDEQRQAAAAAIAAIHRAADGEDDDTGNALVDELASGLFEAAVVAQSGGDAAAAARESSVHSSAPVETEVAAPASAPQPTPVQAADTSESGAPRRRRRVAVRPAGGPPAAEPAVVVVDPSAAPAAPLEPSAASSNGSTAAVNGSADHGSSDAGASSDDLSSDAPTAGEPGGAPPRRRRRAASRPAGPPAA